MLIECRWCGEKIKEGQTACGLSVVRIGAGNQAVPSGVNIVYHVRCWLEMMPRKKPSLVAES
jgi:hypothetical protein